MDRNVNIMLTAVGGPVGVSIIKLIRKAGHRVVGVDVEDDAVGASFCDAFHSVPHADDAGYIDGLLDICKEEGVRLVIPWVDEELMVLGKAREVFLDNGIDIVLSDQNVIEICNDKYETFRYLRDNGYPVSCSYLPETISDIPSADRHMIVKPRTGRGSREIYTAKNRKELEFLSAYVQDPIIQGYLDGQEYTVDVLSDRNGKVLFVVPRKRLKARGVSIKGVVDMNPEIIRVCRDLAEALPVIGPANFQLFSKNGNVKFVEINPRLSGTVILTIAAGLNIPLELIKMYSVENYSFEVPHIKNGTKIQRYWQEIIKWN